MPKLTWTWARYLARFSGETSSWQAPLMRTADSRNCCRLL